MRRSLLLLGVVALVATGCNSTVSTGIDVGGGGTSLTASVHMTGEIASVVNAHPEMATSLDKALTSRMGRPEHVNVSSSEVSWSDTLTYDQLIANSDVLGVAALNQSKSGGLGTTTLTLVEPAGLVKAMTAGVASQRDKDTLLVTMEHFTFVNVVVSYPGNVRVSQDDTGTAKVDGSTVTVSQSVYSFKPGKVVVIGGLAGGGVALWTWGVLGVILAGGGWLAWRSWPKKDQQSLESRR